MGVQSVLRALRRSDRDEINVDVNDRGALLVQQDLPPLAELVNAGVCWQVIEATETAGVVALPTTTAGITLYNNYPDGGLSLVLISVFGFQLVNGAALNSWGLAHCIHAAKPGTLPTADITAFKNLKARQGAYGGSAIVDLGATVVDDEWAPIGGSVGTSVVSLPGTQIDVPMYGMVILPPGGEYSLEAIVSSVDLDIKLGMRWAEVQLPQ